MNGTFKPYGMPVLLAEGGIGHSLNGGINQGGEETSDHANDYSIGIFPTEYGTLEVFYCPTDDNCFVYWNGEYTSIGISEGDPWYDDCPE